MTFGSSIGSSIGRDAGSNPGHPHFPPFARWPRTGDARTIGLHALAYPATPASYASPLPAPCSRRQPGAPFLPFSRGEHAGTY
ncbi:hypothetical protein PFI31113_00774 [Pandoraea fibrosis]|uniref:Uncharacterized protein n=1 Tax=Pandoraea fibrosis TaxID=1891094 RepID=A0A5E4SK81_9BURK|nr:hypothetical protein PFI31113_00774 [Pandoraea fibrosis]